MAKPCLDERSRPCSWALKRSLREADGTCRKKRQAERWSPVGAPRKPCLCAGEEPEDCKRIVEAQRDKKKVHFASLMDIFHLKNAELEPELQKYKGRVLLRGGHCERECAGATGKTGENSQNSGDGAARSSWTRPSVPGCGVTPNASTSFGQSASWKKSPMFLFRK